MAKEQFLDFEEATRETILLKMAIVGPPGSGKSKTSLGLATYLSKTMGLGPVYMIDSENRSSLKYAFNERTGKGYHFKALHMNKDDYSPDAYMRALARAEALGAKIVVIDSISHAWNGVGGILEIVDNLTADSRSKNAFSEGWKKATPLQRRFVQAILASPAHVIVTMRADPDWVVQENERGKKEPTMVGLAPQQRKDISYEFDIVLSIDQGHRGKVEKGRCEELNETNNGVYPMPGENVGRILVDWIRTSDEMTPEQEAGLVSALETAVTAGIAASKAKDKDGYIAAGFALKAWCEANWILSARREDALKTLKDRVAAVAGPKTTAPVQARGPALADTTGAAPPMTDAERAADIDRGAA